MHKTGLLIALPVFVLDFITKALVLKFISAPVAILPFFNIVLVWNRGVSFGMFNDHGAHGPLVLTILALVIVGILLVWLTKITEKWLCVAVWVIIAGALGNIIDRIRFGAVVDFLDFHIGPWHYPAFNIADSAIVLGIAFILFDSIFLEAKRNKK